MPLVCTEPVGRPVRAAAVADAARGSADADCAPPAAEMMDKRGRRSAGAEALDSGGSAGAASADCARRSAFLGESVLPLGATSMCAALWLLRVKLPKRLLMRASGPALRSSAQHVGQQDDIDLLRTLHHSKAADSLSGPATARSSRACKRAGCLDTEGAMQGGIEHLEAVLPARLSGPMLSHASTELNNCSSGMPAWPMMVRAMPA